MISLKQKLKMLKRSAIILLAFAVSLQTTISKVHTSYFSDAFQTQRMNESKWNNTYAYQYYKIKDRQFAITKQDKIKENNRLRSLVFQEPFAQNENEHLRIRLKVKFMNVENSQTSGQVELRLLSGIEGNEQMTFRIQRRSNADENDDQQRRNTTTMMEIDFYKGGSVWVIRPPQLSLNYSLSGEFFTYQLVWCFDDIFEVAVYLDSSNEKIYEFVGKISQQSQKRESIFCCPNLPPTVDAQNAPYKLNETAIAELESIQRYMDPEHKVFNEEYVIKRILIDQNMRNKNYINEDRTSIDPKTSNIFDAPVRALDYSMIVFDDKKAEVQTSLIQFESGSFRELN